MKRLLNNQGAVNWWTILVVVVFVAAIFIAMGYAA